MLKITSNKSNKKRFNVIYVDFTSSKCKKYFLYDPDASIHINNNPPINNLYKLICDDCFNSPSNKLTSQFKDRNNCTDYESNLASSNFCTECTNFLN